MSFFHFLATLWVQKQYNEIFQNKQVSSEVVPEGHKIFSEANFWSVDIVSAKVFIICCFQH